MANSLAHTKWVCKYHIVFTPKYRRKIIYNQLRKDIQQIIRDCEIAWVGGSSPLGTRYGNAIELIGDVENVTVADNYMYQIYDTGITYQYGNYQKNITISGNVIERCTWGIEVLTLPNGTSTDITVEDNYIRLSGYGWGTRPDYYSYSSVQFWKAQGSQENIVFRNNVIDRSHYTLMRLWHLDGQQPIFEGNTYIQHENQYLLDNEGTLYKTDATAAATVKNILNDSTGRVIVIEE